MDLKTPRPRSAARRSGPELGTEVPVVNSSDCVSEPSTSERAADARFERADCPGWLEGGIAMLDAHGLVVGVDESLAVWLGCASAELTGQPFWDRLWERVPAWKAGLVDLARCRKVLDRSNLKQETPAGIRHFTLELAAHEGGAFVRLASALPSFGELGESGCDDYLREEAARREMYFRLLRAEANLDNLVHRWPGVIFSQRADFSFRFASPAIEELTGVALSEWHTQPRRFWQVVHEADNDEFERHIKRCASQRKGLSATFRIRHSKTGRVAYLLEHRQALVSANGLVLGYEGIWLDVTRQIIAEKRLSSAAWKETLAVLTMGLAHDFSNIMAGILSLSESFLCQLEEGHPFREGLSLIKQNSLQAHQLVHRIINLHHGKTGASHYCDLNELVKDLVDLVKKILPRRIEVVTALAPTALPLYTDSVEFRQVIINLTLNAADAMPNGGRITLRTSMHEQLPDLPNLRGVPPRPPAICLAVEDNGCGIKPRHLASVFDPFFTTKPMNKGSGLGLYNTRLFVEKQRGAVSVESQEGVGTTFRIWLPEADFTEAERENDQGSGRRRSVLLLGHADGGVNTTAEFLRCHGYHVVAASSEANAMDLLESVDYQFSGLLIVLEPKDMSLVPMVLRVRQKGFNVKIILQFLGCHPDEVETRFLEKTDVLLSPDMSETEIVDRLNKNLPEPAYEPVSAL